LKFSIRTKIKISLQIRDPPIIMLGRRETRQAQMV